MRRSSPSAARDYGRLGARLVVGSFFVVSGLGKLTASPLPGIPPGLEGFSAYLAAAGVPFPTLAAAVVCAVEIVCGLGLAAGTYLRVAGGLTRWFAACLAVEMAVAMAVVGVPTALGDPVVLNGAPVTNESYRLLLEFGLFVYMLLVSWRSPAGRSPKAGL